MKSKLKIIALVALIALVLVGGSFAYDRLSGQYQEPGEPVSSTQPTPAAAPDFTVKDADGNSVSLSDFRGKPVVINFWASWCGYCVQEMPEFEEAYEEYGEDVVFMMVNLTDGSRETMESAKAYIEGQGYTFPVYFDTEMEAAYAYETYSIPVTYFIGAEGGLVSSIKGAATKSRLFERIEMIL